MTTELTVYKFKEYPVRILKDEKGGPWFVAKDVCDVLDIVNPTRAVSRLDEDEKGLHLVNTPGGAQMMNIITEPGLYKLTMRSDKPQAKEFQRWVTHEVLPSIRKTGSYSVEPITSTTMMKEFARGMVAMADKLDEHDSRIRALEKDKQAVAVITAPVKEISTRSKISQVVREYAHNNGGDYRATFRSLFTEFKYRYSIDLVQRTRNNGNKTVMDTAEECNCLDDLFALAVKLFVGK